MSLLVLKPWKRIVGGYLRIGMCRDTALSASVFPGHPGYGQQLNVVVWDTDVNMQHYVIKDGLLKAKDFADEKLRSLGVYLL